MPSATVTDGVTPATSSSGLETVCAAMGSTVKGGASAPETGFTRIECCNRYAAPGGVFPGAKAPIGWLRGHVGSMYAFLDAVHRGVPASPSFADGAHVQAVMEAAYRSTESGRMEEVHSLG